LQKFNFKVAMREFPRFFETDEYFIDQKINYFKFEVEYKVFDDKGEQIGLIRQKMNKRKKALRLLFRKSTLPFLFEIIDMEGNVVAVLKKNWTWWLSEIYVYTSDDELIGTVRQKWTMLKPAFHIKDTMGNEVARIKGDWKAWNFLIKDSDDQEIGKVTKKWAGAFKESFTNADKYLVSINEGYKEDTNKIVVVSTAITIDMVLKEV